MQIEYKPISQILKEAEEKYWTTEDKGKPEDNLMARCRLAFMLGWVSSEYKYLCLQIEKHNALEKAKEIISS